MDDLLYIKALKPELHKKQLSFLETLSEEDKIEHGTQQSVSGTIYRSDTFPNYYQLPIAVTDHHPM